MIASSSAPQSRSHNSKSNRWTEFRIIPRLETFPWAVAFAQTVLGKVILLSLFCLGLFLTAYHPFPVLAFTLAVALITFMPAYRRHVMTIAPVAIAVRCYFKQPLLLGLNLALMALGMLLYWCVMRWPKSLFAKRPITFLLSGFTAVILMACLVMRGTWSYTPLWGLVGTLSSYLWYFCYAMIDRNSQPGRDATLELSTFGPLWGQNHIPIPKGAAYLRRIEAKNPEQLAIVQLKGLKLLVWALLLIFFQSVWLRFFHAYLRIPTSDQSLAMSVHQTPVVWHLRWESLILAFFESILSLSIWGHQIIACCRMVGFNALRNTRSPLYSTSIIEFFNRYTYYFKELLVEFFYYPTFFRYWMAHRRMRMIFATFAAVFFGNIFFHFTENWTIIQDKGLWNAIVNYQVFAFYCIVLTAGLSISQLRKHSSKPTGFIRGRVIPIIGVLMFYCLLNVFSFPGKSYPLVEHLKYLASLFFIHF